MTLSEIDKIFRDEAGRALATLIRLVGDFDLAEDALQDAFAVAVERWAACGLPDNPRAWLVNVARNKAIDRVRRQAVFRGKQQALVHEKLKKFFEGFKSDAHPMAIMVGVVGALSATAAVQRLQRASPKAPK